MSISTGMLEAERQILKLERQKITISRQKYVDFCLSSKYHILTKAINEVYFVYGCSKKNKFKAS